jgi:hypothetical protein
MLHALSLGLSLGHSLHRLLRRRIVYCDVEVKKNWPVKYAKYAKKICMQYVNMYVEHA